MMTLVNNTVLYGLSGWLSGKESAQNAEDEREAMGLIPESGRSPGGWYGNPFQYSTCQGNSMDRGALQATVHGVAQSQTRLK